MFADLHIHSSFSDGTFTPEEIVKEAKKLELSALAVTDHDCIDGIAPAISAAAELRIEVIPAVELTSEIDDAEIHILGYFIDYKDGQFLERLKTLCSVRRERMHKMVQKLKELEININPEDILALSGNGSVGRLHIAQVLLRNGYVKTIAEAFKKYIGNGGPCYVDRFRLTPKEAIKEVRRIGGIPVLAHPYSIKRDELIPDLVGDGLLGIEVYYPDYTSSVISNYLELVGKYNLLVTGGSDFHGLGRPKAVIGSIKLPYELIEKMKERRDREIGLVR